MEEDAVEVFHYCGFHLSSYFLMYNYKSLIKLEQFSWGPSFFFCTRTFGYLATSLHMSAEVLFIRHALLRLSLIHLSLGCLYDVV